MTEKREPLDLDEAKKWYKSELLHHDIGEVGKRFIAAYQEIERLREEVVRQNQITDAIAKNYNNEIKNPPIHRCGSCGYLDKDKKFFQRLRANQKQLFYCTMNKTYWPLNGFCHNHPDWNASRNDANATELRGEEG